MCRARSPLPAAAVLLRPQPQPRRAQGSTRTVHKAAQRSFPAGLVQTETAAAVTLPRYHQIPLLCNAGLSSATDSAHSTGYPPLGRATGSGKRRWNASGAGHACEGMRAGKKLVKFQRNSWNIHVSGTCRSLASQPAIVNQRRFYGIAWENSSRLKIFLRGKAQL